MDIENTLRILREKKQIVLQGAPGTGKTYVTAELAVRMCDGTVGAMSRDEVMGRYQELLSKGRIAFTTFHQSMDYEQFVEGIVPIVDKEKKSMVYDLRDGIFKKIAKDALWTWSEIYNQLLKEIESANGKYTLRQMKGKELGVVVESTKDGSKAIYFPTDDDDHYKDNTRNNDSKLIRFSKIESIINKFGTLEAFENHEGHSGDGSKQWAVLNKMLDLKNQLISQPHVLIIDEINRGNISKILGELITLLEADKRTGEQNEVAVTLPYSGEKFSVPSNLYIIGTMNTADRSVGYIDYAVRRRFAFVSVEADEEVIRRYYEERYKFPDIEQKAVNLFQRIKAHIADSVVGELMAEDIMVGHSYFLAKGEDEQELEENLKFKFEYEILPLLREYFSDGIITKEFKGGFEE